MIGGYAFIVNGDILCTDCFNLLKRLLESRYQCNNIGLQCRWAHILGPKTEIQTGSKKVCTRCGEELSGKEVSDGANP